MRNWEIRAVMQHRVKTADYIQGLNSINNRTVTKHF